jgi:hypothetical protein
VYSRAQPLPCFRACSCISPDAPTNPVLYYLGRFDPAETKFNLEGSKGPIRLDLGDILYAPNIQTDAEVCISDHAMVF